MNNIFNNDTNISSLHVGNDDVKKVYFGDTLVYEEAPTIPNYLQFKAVNGSATIGITTASTAPNVSYSTDGTNWTTWDFSDISLQEDDTIYFKGNNTNGFSTDSGVTSYNRFTMSGTIESNGSVQSLLYGDNFLENLTIPNTYCFYALFSGCTSMTQAPQVPATSLTNYCYESMFRDCTNLVTPPTELPATALTDYCYADMFSGCTSMATAPAIKATTLAAFSCAVMFYGCTSLTTAPTLNARTLVNGCYRYMFQGCSSLNYIKAMFTTTPSDTYTRNWVSGVASSGTFVKNSTATWNVSGVNGIPTGWTVETASS